MWTLGKEGKGSGAALSKSEHFSRDSFDNRGVNGVFTHYVTGCWLGLMIKSDVKVVIVLERLLQFILVA